ncbi:MAG: FAD-dependent oxidoreductase [Acidobacteriaceae bacterium]
MRPQNSGTVSSTSSARDVVILGAGLIGLATALELADRGASVTVIERGRSLAAASTAAAGMLAAEDPCNPESLRDLSQLSIERYPRFLSRLEALSGVQVPFQTETTFQYMAGGPALRLRERSIDPRQLAIALSAAIRSTPIQLLETTRVSAIHSVKHGNKVLLEDGSSISADTIVYATGAWTGEASEYLDGIPLLVTPRKGQMMRVRISPSNRLHEVHRSERVYIVPRVHGPQAGTAVIGATIEEAGFDTTVHASDLDGLRSLAAVLIPSLGSPDEAPTVESWAGLRPATPDLLPMLGAGRRSGQFVATGHYRNGILLAPATAVVMADLVEGKPPAVDLSDFSPLRFPIAS